jgi:hypothetical protein
MYSELLELRLLAHDTEVDEGRSRDRAANHRELAKLFGELVRAFEQHDQRKNLRAIELFLRHVGSQVVQDDASRRYFLDKMDRNLLCRYAAYWHSVLQAVGTVDDPLDTTIEIASSVVVGLRKAPVDLEQLESEKKREKGGESPLSIQ